MADNKPQITATIKFRDVTIEGMTIQELRELRDVLNTLVGEPERVVERVVERHDHIYPWLTYPAYPYPWTPMWTCTFELGVSTTGTTLGNVSNGTSSSHLTLSCN